MPYAVETMKRERERHERLDRELGQQRQTAERGRHARALKVPAEQRGDEVGGAEDVEAAGESGARDAVHDGQDPWDLGLVDGEVGGVGPVLALGDEDGVAFVFGGGGRCGRSVE